MRRWVTGLGAGEVSAGLQAYSCLRCPPSPLKEVPAQLQNPGPKTSLWLFPIPFPYSWWLRSIGTPAALGEGPSPVPLLLVLVSCAREKHSSRQARGQDIYFSWSVLRGVLLLVSGKHKTAKPCLRRVVHSCCSGSRTGIGWKLWH